MPTPSQISLYSNFEKGVETVREVSEDMDHIDKVTPSQDKDTVQTTNDRLVLNDNLSVAKAIVVCFLKHIGRVAQLVRAGDS